MSSNLEYFDPVDYSLEENAFLLTHIGEPSVVALSGIKASALPNPARGKDGNVRDKNPVFYPDGVNPAAVKPILDRVIELQELETHKGESWCGTAAIKSAITAFLQQDAKWERDAKRGAPRWPSLYSFDGKGRPHLAGPGSDSGKIRTYFDEKGERKQFKVALLGGADQNWKPEWIGAAEVQAPKALILDSEKNRIECPICAHTESFKTESRASYNAARARMSRHLTKATAEVSLHRELHTNEFRS